MAHSRLGGGSSKNGDGDNLSQYSQWEAPTPSPRHSARMSPHEEKIPRCPLWPLGCKFRGKPSDFHFHLNGLPLYHMKLIVSYVAECRAISDKLFPEVNRIIAEYEDVVHRTTCLKVSYGGSQFLWTINNYDIQLQLAREGIRNVIFSRPFYTGKPGYKMIVSTALNGDGEVKGDWDGLMPWPFSQSITISLMDQSAQEGQRHDIGFTLTPQTLGVDNQFFKRPTGERNPSAGARKYAHLGTIRDLNYVNEDSIFLRVQIV